MALILCSCDKCGHQMLVPDRYLGKTVSCRNCYVPVPVKAPVLVPAQPAGPKGSPRSARTRLPWFVIPALLLVAAYVLYADVAARARVQRREAEERRQEEVARQQAMTAKQAEAARQQSELTQKKAQLESQVRRLQAENEQLTSQMRPAKVEGERDAAPMGANLPSTSGRPEEVTGYSAPTAPNSDRPDRKHEEALAAYEDRIAGIESILVQMAGAADRANTACTSLLIDQMYRNGPVQDSGLCEVLKRDAMLLAKAVAPRAAEAPEFARTSGVLPGEARAIHTKHGFDPAMASALAAEVMSSGGILKR